MYANDPMDRGTGDLLAEIEALRAEVRWALGLDPVSPLKHEREEDVDDQHLRDLVFQLKSELVTDRERESGGGGGEVVRTMLDDELLARVRRGVEMEDAVRAYLEELDGPLADPSASLARLRAAVGR